MLEKIVIAWQNFDSFVFDNSYSLYELVNTAVKKINEVIDFVNGFQSQITGLNTKFDDKVASLEARKENSIDITNNRKLSVLGNFTGTILGRTILSIFSDIDNSLSLSQTLIAMVNSRESIGTIYDGGNFVDTDPPTITIEGGLF